MRQEKNAQRANKSGSDLVNFFKKDISELKTINKVVSGLDSQAEGDENIDLETLIAVSVDNAVQLEGLLFNEESEGGAINTAFFDDIKNSKSADDFTQSVKNSAYKELQNLFSGDEDLLTALSLYEDRAQDILSVLRFANDEQKIQVISNLESLDSVMNLTNKFRTQDIPSADNATPGEIKRLNSLNSLNRSRLDKVFDNLDIVDSLSMLVDELSLYPDRLDYVFANIDLAPSILAKIEGYKFDDNGNPNPDADRLISELFGDTNLADTLANEELANLLSAYPKYSDQINSNPDRAAEISALIDMLGENHAESVLSNLNQFDNLQTLVFRTKNNTVKIQNLFGAVSKNSERIQNIYSISENINELKVPGGQDALFSSINAFEADPIYYTFALEHPKLFVQLYDVTEDISRVPSTLAYELEVLDLTRTELVKVLGDLIEGPLSDGPTNSPPDDENLENEFSAVSLLESHSFNGEIPLNLVLSESQVLASQLFQETLDTYDALSELDHDDDSYEGESPDSPSDDYKSGVLGGVNITFGEGNYDLSKISYNSLIVASSEDISLSGDISFSSATSNIEELLFISGASINFTQGTIIDFSGDSLGFGSFDSLEIINVDLHAEDSIGVRSLDSIVIENSEFATRGTGADEIHMIAAADLTIDNLRFSDQVRQITMEAMTINLSNLNFPNGSMVNLNSAYGGIDGVYPNFGSVATGRVNFIKNVQYNSNLINSKASFVQHGANISIGVLGK